MNDDTSKKAKGQRAPIQLFMVGPLGGIPFATSAPFPLKLETWLRMTGLAYEVRIENNMGKGPKKKTPWIEDGDVRMGDTELIIQHLKSRYGVDPDEGMSPVDLAVATAWHRTFEEHFHQAFEHQLFFGVGGAERIAEFLTTLPALARPIVGPMARRAFRKQLYARGLGRHDEATIIAMGKADLDAANTFLGEKRYFFGDTPRTVDAMAFGFLALCVYMGGENPLYRYAASLENIRAYTDRMRARYFPETLGATETVGEERAKARSPGLASAVIGLP